MSSGVFRPRGYRSVRVCLTMSFTWVTVWTITVQRCRNRRGPLSQSVLRFHSRLTVHATLDQIGQKSAIVTKYFFRCKRSVGFVVFRCRDFCSHSIGDLDWHPHTLLSVSVVWLIRRCIWSSIDLFFFWRFLPLDIRWLSYRFDFRSSVPIAWAYKHRYKHFTCSIYETNIYHTGSHNDILWELSKIVTHLVVRMCTRTTDRGIVSFISEPDATSR